MSDASLARDIAAEAGALLAAIQAEGREEGRALGHRGDAEANALILARLRAERPDDFVLSEEAVDDPARCQASRLWVVDPLDGTREYGDLRGDWAVHVALSVNGDPVVGAVALPARGLVLGSDAPPPLAPMATPLRIVVSRSRPPREAGIVAEALSGTLVPMGSAGAKAMAVVLGEADVYVHSGGQHAWDNCAPAAVALAAGLHVSRLDGSPLVYNCVDTWTPDLLICPKPLVGQILDALRTPATG